MLRGGRGAVKLQRLCAALLVASLGLAPGGAALAQSVEGKLDIADVDLQSLLDLSVEAVSLKEERSSEASASVFVLSGEDLRRQGFRTLDEALRSVPGLFVYADGLYPQAGVRGIGNLADFTTRILVLVDGHPLNNSLALGESYIGRDLPIPLAAVRRLEVIKGPVGSLYGPTAYLGVVNLVTTGGPPGAEVTAYGDAAQRAARGGGGTVVASGRTGDLSWFASGEGFGTRGLDQRYPELTSRTIVDRDHARAFESYARLSWRGLTASASCGDFRRGLASAPWLSLVGDDRNTLENRTCFAQLALSRWLSRTIAVDARVAYDHFQYWDKLAYSPPPDGEGIFTDYGRDSWVSGDARATWQPLPGTRLVLGEEVEAHDTIQHSQSEDQAVWVAIPKSFKTFNTYFLFQQQLLSTLTFHGGVTYYVHELFGDRVTPKLALVWRPTASDTVKALWTEGFRAPTAGEAYFADGTSYLANPDLKPELARSFEVDYVRRFGAVASVTLSAFQNEYRNLITIVTVPAPGVVDPQSLADYRQMSVNAGALRLRGAEAAVTLRWQDHVQAWGGVSVQSVDQAGRPNVPSWTANFAVSTRALWRPLMLSLNGAAVGRRDKDPTAAVDGAAGSVPAALVLNAFTALDVPHADGLTVELGVQNLLGATALDPVSGDFAPITSMAQPARTVRAGLRYRF